MVQGGFVFRDFKGTQCGAKSYFSSLASLNKDRQIILETKTILFQYPMQCTTEKLLDTLLCFVDYLVRTFQGTQNMCFQWSQLGRIPNFSCQMKWSEWQPETILADIPSEHLDCKIRVYFYQFGSLLEEYIYTEQNTQLQGFFLEQKSTRTVKVVRNRNGNITR